MGKASAIREHPFGTVASVVEMVQVLSSNIAEIGYDARSSLLLVRFHEGARTYRYAGVPAGTYRAFLSAPSKGRFLADFIKGHYPYTRVA